MAMDSVEYSNLLVRVGKDMQRIAAADLERSRYEAHGVARWDTDFDRSPSTRARPKVR